MSLSLEVRPSFLAAIFMSTALLASTSLMFAQSDSIQPANRVRGPIVESDVVTLAGNTHPLAKAENDRGPLAPETRLDRMVMLLKPGAAQRKALDALVEAQQTPGGPMFHHWLTPEEYGSRFGASNEDVAKISGWLESHGFSVEPAPAGHRLLIFSGTAGQVEEAFHASIHRYRVQGAEHIANVEDPQIPRALSPVVAGLVSLHDFRRKSETRAAKRIGVHPEYTQGSTHYLFPADFATIYDLNPLYAAGETGTGVSIAIVGRSNINLSDVSGFRSFAGLTANQPTVILEGANPGLVSGDQDESTLDVEWSGAVAPAATVKFVVAASTQTTDGVDLSAQYIVNNKTAPVMSTSYGSCEAYMGSTEVAFYNSLWQQAASEGISSFVSSGDSGAAGCNGGSSSTGSGTGVNGLCSSPYSTCVGGTEFNEGSGNYWASSNGAGDESALGYIPEMVWNESGSNGGSGLWSSGGGISIVYAQPSWQAGVSGANSNGMRAVPDVALTSAGHDGYIVCLNGSYYIFSGTSASSPSFAGIMSLIVQKQGGSGQGNASPALYGMLSASANPFHATPSGNNSVPGVTGFTASGASYNMATGLGSVDANVLVSGWGGGSVVSQQGFTLTPSVTSESLLPGKSATFTVSVKGTGGFTGSVVLSAVASSGVSISFSPATVKAGATSTATLTVASSAAAGSSTVTLNGVSGSIHSGNSLPLTVLAPPTLSVSDAASALTVAQGKTTTLAVTVATGSTFSGAVSLSVSGMPTGVTASWSKSSFTPATGGASTPVTLTLTAASTAALSTGTLHIVATGDGLSAQTTSTVQVTAAPSIKVALSPATVSMLTTGSQQVVVTATPQGGVKAASGLAGVSFTATGLPAGVTAAWGAATLSASGAVQATVTLTGSSSAKTGSTAVTIKAAVTDAASGTQYSATTPLTVALSAPHSITVNAGVSQTSVAAGKGVALSITVTTGGSFSSAVSLAVSGLPSGVTARWSANPIAPTGSSGVAYSTLTLTAAANAAPASTTIQISATGGGVTGTQNVGLQVLSGASIRPHSGQAE